MNPPQEEQCPRATRRSDYQFWNVNAIGDNGNRLLEAQPPYVLKGTGKVALISLGKAPNIKLNMFIYIQVNADGSVVDLGSVFEGDISCDPSSEL